MSARCPRKSFGFSAPYDRIMNVSYHSGTAEAPSSECHEDDVRFEVLTAVVMNVAIFWVIAPCCPVA
jgi:hypothetical protein